MSTTQSNRKYAPPNPLPRRLSDYPAAERYAILRQMSDDLRRLIDKAGGLHTEADLARRWGVSRQRIRELTEMDDFPQPVLVIGRSKLYAGYECDTWRELPRKPGPKPPTKDTMT